VRRGTADADRADQLFIDDDWKPPGIGEEAELDLVSLLSWIFNHGIHVHFAGFASH
jgi:hypothetical protein